MLGGSNQKMALHYCEAIFFFVLVSFLKRDLRSWASRVRAYGWRGYRSSSRRNRHRESLEDRHIRILRLPCPSRPWEARFNFGETPGEPLGDDVLGGGAQVFEGIAESGFADRANRDAALRSQFRDRADQFPHAPATARALGHVLDGDERGLVKGEEMGDLAEAVFVLVPPACPPGFLDSPIRERVGGFQDNKSKTPRRGVYGENPRG